jgi:hypothetical protein
MSNPIEPMPEASGFPSNSTPLLMRITCNIKGKGWRHAWPAQENDEGERGTLSVPNFFNDLASQIAIPLL